MAKNILLKKKLKNNATIINNKKSNFYKLIIHSDNEKTINIDEYIDNNYF